MVFMWDFGQRTAAWDSLAYGPPQSGWYPLIERRILNEIVGAGVSLGLRDCCGSVPGR